MLRFLCCSGAAAAIVAAAVAQAAAASGPMTLVVDAREAPRNILHVQMTVPVDPGPLTLVYPKWIPGEHGPTGPIQSLAALRIAANGSPLAWQRDLVDLYAFHVDVPAGSSNVTVTFDQLMTSQDAMSTPNMLIVNWNRVLLYPSGKKPADVKVDPSILLPQGWKYGTALAGPKQSDDKSVSIR
jgi:predicted metalloprotease with PDZ domain